jgi:tetratricopeptide (TPR) repeat protein
MNNSKVAHDSPFRVGRSAASDGGRLCSRLLLTAVLLSSAAAPMLAQTGASGAANAHDHLQKAEAYLKSNDPDSAAREFKAVLALDSRNAEAYANLGVIAFVRHDCQTAALNLRKALAINSSLEKTRALLGVCERRLGDPSSRATLENSFAKLNDKKLRLQVGLELASLYEERGDPGATVSVMHALVDLAPDNVDVLFMAQRVYSELADDTLNKLAVLAPGSARMQEIIAQHLINQGDLKGAIDHYRKSLQIDPRVPGIHYELGEAILESGRSDAATQAEAQKELEASIAVDGDAPKTECELAEIALLQSEPDRALAHYQRAYRLNPNEVQAEMGLANLAMHENPQEAVTYLRMAVQSDPLNGSAHYQLARAYQRLQMNELAEKELHLSQEIKKTKEQVEGLYHQMNRYKKPESYEESDKNTVEPNHDGRN